MHFLTILMVGSDKGQIFTPFGKAKTKGDIEGGTRTTDIARRGDRIGKRSVEPSVGDEPFVPRIICLGFDPS